jgi:SRSO17 transposase
MTPAWAQRHEALLRDCIVSPAVFASMVDRLGDFVVPYQHALETEASKRPMHLYLAGLLSHLDRKNAEKIAALVEVERLVIQAFIGTAPWDHRPLIKVLVGQVVGQLGDPDGIIAFDPSSFPKRGMHSMGVKRQWCSHRGKVDHCQVGVYMGYVSRPDHALLDFRLSLPEEWVRDKHRRQACHVPDKPRHDLLYASASFPRLDFSQSKRPLLRGHQWLPMLPYTTSGSVLDSRCPLTSGGLQSTRWRIDRCYAVSTRSKSHNGCAGNGSLA